MYLVICVCVFFFINENNDVSRHCHLSRCENKLENTFIFRRMMQLDHSSRFWMIIGGCICKKENWRGGEEEEMKRKHNERKKPHTKMRHSFRFRFRLSKLGSNEEFLLSPSRSQPTNKQKVWKKKRISRRCWLRRSVCWRCLRRIHWIASS